jgi:hypothetical protein
MRMLVSPAAMADSTLAWVQPLAQTSQRIQTLFSQTLPTPQFAQPQSPFGRQIVTPASQQTGSPCSF